MILIKKILAIRSPSSHQKRRPHRPSQVGHGLSTNGHGHDGQVGVAFVSHSKRKQPLTGSLPSDAPLKQTRLKEVPSELEPITSPFRESFITTYVRKNKTIRSLLQHTPDSLEGRRQLAIAKSVHSAINQFVVGQPTPIPSELKNPNLDLALIYDTYYNTAEAKTARASQASPQQGISKAMSQPLSGEHAQTDDSANKATYTQQLNAFQLILYLQQYSGTQPLIWEDRIPGAMYEASPPYTVQLTTPVLRAHLEKNFERHTWPITADKLQAICEEINNLPKHDNYFLKIPLAKPSESPMSDQTQIAYILSKCPFFFRTENSVSAFETMYLPSMSVFNILLKLMPYPVKFEGFAMLGRIGVNTRKKVHALGLHPLPFSSPHVKFNYPEVHNKKCGPLLIWVHDMYHIFMSGLFSQKHFKFVHEKLIPFVNTLPRRSKYMKIFIDDFLDSLDDFNFEMREESDSGRRFIGYANFYEWFADIVTYHVDHKYPSTILMPASGVYHALTGYLEAHQDEFKQNYDFDFATFKQTHLNPHSARLV